MESLHLNAIDADNFGSLFLPYLEVSLNNKNPERYNTYKDLDNSKLDNSNNSNISDLDGSYNMNQSYINNNRNILSVIQIKNLMSHRMGT